MRSELCSEHSTVRPGGCVLRCVQCFHGAFFTMFKGSFPKCDLQRVQQQVPYWVRSAVFCATLRKVRSEVRAEVRKVCSKMRVIFLRSEVYSRIRVEKRSTVRSETRFKWRA